MPHAFKLMPALIIVLLIAVSGCSSGNQRHPIQGQISFQGKPVLEGSIMFHPLNPQQGFLEGSLIQDGKYLIPADKGLVTGKYQVLISAPDHKGKRPDPASAPGAVFEARELFPEMYNTKSTLTVEVSSQGPNHFDFHLK